MRFGIIADPHLAPPGTEPYQWHNTVELSRSSALLDAALAWLRGQRIDRLVLLGDLTEAADRESFTVVREWALDVGVPVLAVPGNCDVDPIARSATAFEQIAGEGLTVAPAVLPLADGPAIELIGLSGEIGSKQLAGVRAHSDARGARVILTHYPLLDLEPELAAVGFRHSGNLTNRADIEAVARAVDGPVVVVHGHLHVQQARVSGSLLHLSCAALIEPPHQVSVIEISETDGGLTVERATHSVRAYDAGRLPVFSPGHGRWVWNGASWAAA
jgi:predicted phosphodiesterase